MGGWRRNRGAFNFFWLEYGGLKMPTDDLGVAGGGGVFKFPLSSIPTEQYDA